VVPSRNRLFALLHESNIWLDGESEQATRQSRTARFLLWLASLGEGLASLAASSQIESLKGMHEFVFALNLISKLHKPGNCRTSSFSR